MEKLVSSRTRNETTMPFIAGFVNLRSNCKLRGQFLVVGKFCFMVSALIYSITQKVNETFSVYYMIEFVLHRIVNSMFTSSNYIEFQINTVAFILHVKYNFTAPYTCISLVKYCYRLGRATAFQQKKQCICLRYPKPDYANNASLVC